MKLLCGFWLFAAALLAADVSGKWSGTLEAKAGGSRDCVMQLQQKGDQLTGTAGPHADEQFPISDGKVQGEKVSFQVNTPGGDIYRFSLDYKQAKMEGDLQVKRGEDILEARVSLTKGS